MNGRQEDIAGCPRSARFFPAPRAAAGACLIVVTLVSGAAIGKPAKRRVPPGRPDATPSASRGASFKAQVLPILKRSCLVGTRCHLGAMAAAGLRLDGPNPYAALVKARSSLRPTWVRVVPGRPDQSVLWLMLTGKNKAAGIFGDRMPPDKPLPPSALRVIERWIRQGAPR